MKIDAIDSNNYNILLSDNELCLLLQIIYMGIDMLQQQDYELKKRIKNDTDEKQRDINYKLFHEIVSQSTAAAIMADTISQTVGNRDSLIIKHKIKG